MTRDGPQERPSAQEALQHWRQIRSRIPTMYRLCRLREREESWIVSVILDVAAMLKVVCVIAKRFAGWSWHWLRLIFS